MEYERVHFLLNLNSDSALSAVENSLAAGGFQVVDRQKRWPRALLGSKHPAKADYELTVMDYQCPVNRVESTDSSKNLHRIVIRAGRGAYTEVFLVPSDRLDDVASIPSRTDIPEATAVRLARVILEAGRYAFCRPVLNPGEEASVNYGV